MLSINLSGSNAACINNRVPLEAEDNEVYSLASDSFVCTQDMSTQVDEKELNSFVNQQKQAATGYKSDSGNLTDRKIEALDSESIANIDSEQVYQDRSPNFIEKGLNNIALWGYWTTVKVAHSVRSFFYQSEYELLLALCDPAQEVRVSQTWFFSRDRELLYGISKSRPKEANPNASYLGRFFGGLVSFAVNFPRYILDTAKMWYYEGVIFKRWPQFNALALVQVVPFVAGERIEKVTANLQEHIQVVLQKLNPVKERLDYLGDSQLQYYEAWCKEALEAAYNKTCEFVTTDVGTADPLFKMVEKKFSEILNTHFSAHDSYFNKRFKISSLKVNAEQVFAIGNSVAKKIREMRDVYLEKYSPLEDTRENKIARIKAYQELLQQTSKLIADKQELLAASLENYREFIVNTWS